MINRDVFISLLRTWKTLAGFNKAFSITYMASREVFFLSAKLYCGPADIRLAVDMFKIKHGFRITKITSRLYFFDAVSKLIQPGEEVRG